MIFLRINEKLIFLPCFTTSTRKEVPSLFSNTILLEHDCIFLHVQDSIGWYNFINRFISKHWRGIQQAYLKEIGSIKSPNLWIAQFQQWMNLGDCVGALATQEWIPTLRWDNNSLPRNGCHQQWNQRRIRD